MARRALLVLSMFSIMCGAPSTPVATIVGAPSASSSATSISVANVKGAYPSPPQQGATWNAPATKLDATVVAAAKTLFDQGLADPRGCAYREIELVTGSVWSGGGETTKTHGWVLPGDAFAIAWNGLVYRVKSVGGPADVRADATAMLAADDAARTKQEHDSPGFPYHRFPSTAEAYFVATESVTLLKAFLLLRLGEGELADKTFAHAMGDSKDDAYYLAAQDWTWSLYDRGITAHMRGDSALAIESWLRLPAIATLIDAECVARSIKRPTKNDAKQTPASFISFIDGVPELLADEQRRVASSTSKIDPAALASLSQPDRIKKLVAGLDQVSARQWGQPGGVSLAEDPIVQALMKEGEPAVDALLEVFENDTRLTQSVQFWRDFARYRSVLAVYEAAYIALSGILDASFFDAVSTGDHLTARGLEGRREVGKKIRAHWAKWKGVPMEERLYQTLADDSAGAEGWLTAAAKITQPSNVQTMPSSGVFQSTFTTNLPPGQKPTLRGEALRTKTSPSVNALFVARMPAMPDARHTCALARAFAAWDAKAALPQVTNVVRQSIAAFATSNEKSSAGACIASLTTDRANAGDANAYTDYAAWIATTTPKDAEYSLERWFAPMIASPKSPAIAHAASVMFKAGSPWVPFVSDKAGYQLMEILKLDLLKVDAFKAHAIAELADKKKFGTITIKSKTNVELKTPSYTSSQGADQNDPLAPPDGTVMDLRVCDEYAANLASHTGAPPFRVYWRVHDRDAAITSMIAWARKL